MRSTPPLSEKPVYAQERNNLPISEKPVLPSEVNDLMVINGHLREMPSRIDPSGERGLTLIYEAMQMDVVGQMNRVCHHIGLRGCPPEDSAPSAYVTAVQKRSSDDLRDAVLNFGELVRLLAANGTHPSPCVLNMLLAATPQQVFPQCPLLAPRASGASAYLAVSAMADGCAVGATEPQRSTLDDPFCEVGAGGYSTCLPRLWLIGASKSATSSLALHLSGHPRIQIRCGKHSGHVNDHELRDVEPIWEALNKRVQIVECDGSREVHVYDTVGDASVRLRLEQGMSSPMRHGSDLSLEYTPNYLYHPTVPGRVRAAFEQLGRPELLQRMRFIAILREPVARTLSSYWSKGGTGAEDAMRTLDEQMEAFRRQEATSYHPPLTTYLLPPTTYHLPLATGVCCQQ